MSDTVTAPPKHVGVLVVCTQEEAELLAAITRGERDTYDTRTHRAVEILGAIPEGAPDDGRDAALASIAAALPDPSLHVEILTSQRTRIASLESEVARLTRERDIAEAVANRHSGTIEKLTDSLAAYREVAGRLNPAQLHNIARVMEREADREYGKSRENIQELRVVAGQMHDIAAALASLPPTGEQKDG